MKWRISLVGWVPLTIGAFAAFALAGQPPRGQKIFEQSCANCHDLDRNKVGPRLRGIVGSRSALVKGFSYSDALRKANLQWTEDTLDQWLADPEKLAPDNDMAFHLGSETDRRAVIAFLKQVSGKQWK